MGIHSVHMEDTVYFLIFSGQFMFLYFSRFILGDGYAPHDAVLPEALHTLAINVKTGLLFLEQHTFPDQLIEVSFCHVIDTPVMGGNAGREVNIRFLYMEKAKVIAFRDPYCLFLTDHVIE